MFLYFSLYAQRSVLSHMLWVRYKGGQRYENCNKNNSSLYFGKSFHYTLKKAPSLIKTRIKNNKKGGTPEIIFNTRHLKMGFLY